MSLKDTPRRPIHVLFGYIHGFSIAAVLFTERGSAINTLGLVVMVFFLLRAVFYTETWNEKDTEN